MLCTNSCKFKKTCSYSHKIRQNCCVAYKNHITDSKSFLFQQCLPVAHFAARYPKNLFSTGKLQKK